MFTVTFKCDSCDGSGGWGGVHSRDCNSREEADLLVENLKEAGDAYDIEISDESEED